MNTYTYVLPEIKREAIDTAAKSSSSEGPDAGRQHWLRSGYSGL